MPNQKDGDSVFFVEQTGVKEEKERRAREPGEQFMVNVLGRLVPAITTDEGITATIKGKPIDPNSVRYYLENNFGKGLEDVQTAMEELARAYKPDKLAAKAYCLYEKLRPEIPEVRRGWVAKEELDLDYIRSLAR